ncbi:hypothetical protein SAMN06264849_101252 [Melghirimyces algeriensis]|uniref:Uncharacterized protein n=1 Tax=Melghirimyces algeriensis TaxID=910412 RepID=A0A521ANR7_9BACL|nr:hypothetical protein SAMN06264849_101252 [Melghirimyces algeriensis]
MTKKLSIWGIAVTFFLALLVFISPTAFAENEKDLSDKVEKLEQKVDKLSAKDDSYDYLKEETKSYRQFVEKEWEMFSNMVIGISAVTVSVVGGVLLFFGFHSKKAIKNIQKEYTEQVEEMKEKLEKEANQKFYELMESKVTELRHKVNELETMIAKESWFQNSNILVLYRDELKDIVSTSPLSRKKIEYRALPDNNLAHHLSQEKVDIVLYEYDTESNSQEDSCIADVLDELKKHKDTIPIVIYCSGEIKNEDMMKEIKSYRWYQFARSQVSLTTHTYAFAQIFH